MKTKEELYHKVYQSPRLLQVILKPTSQSGQQDQHEQEARKSSDHQSVSGSFCETRSGNIDYRIPGIPLSTVQQQDTNRKETVKNDSAKRESCPISTDIHRRYQNYRYNFRCDVGKISTIIGTLMENENCQIRGQVLKDSLH